ncbi:MAG: hypothetical protein R2713_16740 [Ilumatobacteraceae bacterium]
MELKRLTTMAKSFGLPMEVISPQRAQELFPLDEHQLTCSPLRFLPTDGYIDPSSVTRPRSRRAHARRHDLRADQGRDDRRRRPPLHSRSNTIGAPMAPSRRSSARWR